MWLLRVEIELELLELGDMILFVVDMFGGALHTLFVESLEYFFIFEFCFVSPLLKLFLQFPFLDVELLKVRVRVGWDVLLAFGHIY